MSGVYIKDMQVPENCAECRFAGCCGAHPVDEWPDIESIISNEVIGVGGKRDNACPLTAVPDHGRLIDADKMLADNEIFYNQLGRPEGEVGARYRSVKASIKLAPTIIPADKEVEQ